MEEVAELTEIEDLESEEFYGFIRRHLICVLFFMFLYTLSYLTIKQLKIRPDYDDLYAGDEDYFVYRISTWICSKSLSISIGAVTLLPFSIVGAEVLQRYPENYYLKWLNFSLINTLWKYVFLLSNLSLFVLLPFSYFFIESQGFSMNIRLQTLSGSIRRPLLARFYETLTICALVIVVLIGIADVFYSHLLSYPSYIWLSLLCFSSLTMPLLYSFASLIGVFLLLLSVPVGFAKIFDKFSHFPDIFTTHHQRSPSSDHHHTKKNGMSSMAMLTPESLQEMANRRQKDKQSRKSNNFVYRPLLFQMSNANGDVKTKTQQHRPRRRSCSAPRSSSRHRMMGGWMRQNLGPFLGKCNQILDFLMFPVIMVAFFLLTALCILMVMSNSLQLLFGFRNLPAYVHYVEEYRHTLGIFGALMEVTIIMYIMTSALVGIYSIPLVRRIKPHRHGTSQTSLIVNCMMISLMCSALPVLVKTLGITTFDLLGDYGRINWISNLSLVLSYNILFAAVSIYCIVYKFSEPVRRELLRRFFTVTNKIPEFRYMNGAISTMNQHDLKKRN